MLRRVWTDGKRTVLVGLAVGLVLVVGGGVTNLSVRGDPWDYPWKLTVGETVGIGTESPEKMLDIASNTYPFGIALRSTLLGGVTWNIDNDVDFKIIEDWSALPERHKTRLTISHVNGNVGIGTMEPSKKLDVRGTFFAGETAVSGIGISIEGTTIKPANVPGSPERLFSNLHLDSMYAGGNGHVILAESGGNVGIGTDNPQSKLEICTSDYVGLSLEGNTIQSINSCPGTGPLPINVDLNLKSTGLWGNIILDPGAEGGVGIGTEPQEKLFVDGNIGTNAAGRRIYLRSNAGSPGRNANFNPKLFYEGMISGDGSGIGDTLGWGLHLNALPWTWGQDAIYYHGGTHRFYTANDGDPESEKVRITSDGNVGIGTTEPFQFGKLTIEQGHNDWISLRASQNNNIWRIHNPADGRRLEIGWRDGNTGQDEWGLFVIKDDGNVGIGTSQPKRKLHVSGGGAILNSVTVGTDPDPSSYDFEHRYPYETIGVNSPGHNLRLTSPGLICFHPGGSDPASDIDVSKQVVINSEGNVGIGRAPDAKLTIKGSGVILRGYDQEGKVIVEIGEGLDFSETFPTAQDEIAPGTVVIIDPVNNGFLAISSQAYDKKVAGIIAGAKGLGSGVRLGPRAEDGGDHAVALAGRVYCNVDTQYGDIEPGDLLTTSPTPGHAMVVRDFSKAHGAILGKAMGGLSGGGKGQILVLVTLQ